MTKLIVIPFFVLKKNRKFKKGFTELFFLKKNNQPDRREGYPLHIND